MLRATKGTSRSRRAAALLLAICMTMMTILPSLATPAKAIAGVDDVAVAAFVATLFVGTGVTIQHVTSSDAFKTAVVSYWNKTVTSSSEIYKSFTRWLRDGYVTLKQDALAWVHTAASNFLATDTGIEIDSTYSANSYYLGSMAGLPMFDDAFNDYQTCPTLGSFVPTVSSITANCGIKKVINGENMFLAFVDGNCYYSQTGIANEYYNEYWSSTDQIYIKVKEINNHPTLGHFFQLALTIDSSITRYFPSVKSDNVLFPTFVSLYSKTYNPPSTDVVVTEPDTWTVNTEDLQPDPEKDDKHQPIAFIPFIPHWSNQDLLNKLLDGTAKPEIETTTSAAKGLDITDVTENEDTDHVNYTPLVTAASGITEVFPFCIPFDLVKIAKNFNVAAVAPVWTVTLFHDIGFDLPITLDFTPYNDLFEPFRILETIFFMIGLALITYKMIKW